ncbi:MBL fold metallo-hydrolase [Leptospira adleri]|uniref:Zn-dependent hydrolase n=1 Tax=Leptospira adleri TaxID=2023186 RepID=A0A2M9YLA4_9LEPT|nr:MBL fold metallo-hydrolase [Leptospira adleri]PJZ52329.1 Zn-dependent hydrolase [Leptospira adleri]PJZ63536.1 Zn-dependent hydrolase [Leptospira adleri]
MKRYWIVFGIVGIIILSLLIALGYPKLEISYYPREERGSRKSLAFRNPGVRFALLKTAIADTSEAFLFEGGNLFKKRVISHSALLVEHPSGKFLFDTGLGSDINEQFALNPIHLRVLMAYKDHRPAVDLLKKEGYDPKRIERIFLSHMHWDHASGIKDFPWAKVLTTQEERYAAFASNVRHGYIQRQFDGDLVQWENLVFKDAPYETYSKSLDLFQDGSIVFVPMEGHGGGSIGLFINLSEKKRYFFTGDISWSKEGFLIPAHKPRLSRRIADKDPDSLGKELARVHELILSKPEINVIPAHDSIAQEGLANFPNWNR